MTELTFYTMKCEMYQDAETCHVTVFAFVLLISSHQFVIFSLISAAVVFTFASNLLAFVMNVFKLPIFQ